MERLSRENFFVESALLVSRRSTCNRKQVGAVLVRDGRIIATGYNGVLPNIDPKFGLDENGNSKTVHSEANIISFCAKHGISTNQSTLYVTLSPCEKCAELIIQSGISRVYYIEEYRCTSGIELLNNMGISCLQIK